MNYAQQKTASAHDLRRSFGSRWAGKAKPATLRLLVRHESIETTLKYYVEQDVEELGAALWQAWETNEQMRVPRSGRWATESK